MRDAADSELPVPEHFSKVGVLGSYPAANFSVSTPFLSHCLQTFLCSGVC